MVSFLLRYTTQDIRVLSFIIKEDLLLLEMSEFRKYLLEAENDFTGKDYSEALLKCEDLIKEDATPKDIKIEATVLSIKIFTHTGQYDEALSRFLSSPTHALNPKTELIIINLYDLFFDKAVSCYKRGDYRMARILAEACNRKCEPVFKRIPFMLKGKLIELQNLQRLIDLKQK